MKFGGNSTPEFTHAEIDRAIASATRQILLANEENALEKGDIDTALFIGEIMSEIREYTKEILDDEDHPAWNLAHD